MKIMKIFFKLKLVSFFLLQPSRRPQVFRFVELVLGLGFDEVALSLLPLRLGIEQVGQGAECVPVPVLHHAQVLVGLGTS